MATAVQEGIVGYGSSAAPGNHATSAGAGVIDSNNYTPYNPSQPPADTPTPTTDIPPGKESTGHRHITIMPIRRTIKNVVKNYTDAQIKVREATSNDPWGPSSTMMSEIADLTYNVLAFTEIMQMVWKRLNDHGKNWRHVYKSLVLLDYIIKTGSEKVAQQCKENIFAIETLKNFQYVEDGKDHGMNVREKAKQLVQLLKDDERLKNERAKALKAKERFAQNTMGIGSAGQRVEPPGDSPPPHSGYSDLGTATTTSPESPALNPDGTPVNPELEAARPSTAGEEELQLQLALAMSREEAEEDDKRKRNDDIKLQMALDESTKEAPQEGSADTLLDLSLGAAAAASPVSSDPWGTTPTQTADPWGGQSKPVAADPWNSPSKGPQSTDPWTPSQSQTTTPMQPSDPWGGIGQVPGSSSNGAYPPKAGGIDDEFDMIGSRSKSPAGGASSGVPASTTMNGGSHGNPWDMGGLSDSLPHSSSSDQLSVNNGPLMGDAAIKSKSPEQFLGNHANLVNLDNLVTKPTPPSATNPFAMTNPGGGPPPEAVPNPFANREQVAPRVPMNQMSSSSSMGFTGATNSSLGPAPGPTMQFPGGAPPGGSPAFGQPMGPPVAAPGMMAAPPMGVAAAPPYNMSPAFGQPPAPMPAPMPAGYGQMAAQPPTSYNPFL